MKSPLVALVKSSDFFLSSFTIQNCMKNIARICSQGSALQFWRCFWWKVAWFCVWRGCVIFLTHSLTQVALFSGGCLIFLRRGCIIFLWRGCVLFFVESYHFFCGEVAWFFWWTGCVIFVVERFCDHVCGEVAWFLCVERLCDFSHSLTHSSFMIFFLEVTEFFLRRGCMIFSWEIMWFFVWRGSVIFCAKRLRDFFYVKKLHDFLGEEIFRKKKKILFKTVFWWKKKVFFGHYCNYCHYCHYCPYSNYCHIGG